MDSKQFKKVSQSVERFDQHLSRRRGVEADTARNHKFRNDNYQEAGEDDRRTAEIDYHNARCRHHLPKLVRSPSGRGSMFDGPNSKKTTGDPPDQTNKVSNASILFRNSFAATVFVAQRSTRVSHS